MLEILQNVFMPLEEMRNKAYPIEMHRLRRSCISSNEEEKMKREVEIQENNKKYSEILTEAKIK